MRIWQHLFFKYQISDNESQKCSKWNAIKYKRWMTAGHNILNIFLNHIVFYKSQKQNIYAQQTLNMLRRLCSVIQHRFRYWIYWTFDQWTGHFHSVLHSMFIWMVLLDSFLIIWMLWTFSSNSDQIYISFIVAVCSLCSVSPYVCVCVCVVRLLVRSNAFPSVLQYR